MLGRRTHLVIYTSLKYALSKFVLHLFYCTLGRLQIMAQGIMGDGAKATQFLSIPATTYDTQKSAIVGTELTLIQTSEVSRKSH